MSNNDQKPNKGQCSVMEGYEASLNLDTPTSQEKVDQELEAESVSLAFFIGVFY